MKNPDWHVQRVFVVLHTNYHGYDFDDLLVFADIVDAQEYIRIARDIGLQIVDRLVITRRTI